MGLNVGLKYVFLDASESLYEALSVGQSVHWSVRPSVGLSAGRLVRRSVCRLVMLLSKMDEKWTFMDSK